MQHLTLRPTAPTNAAATPEEMLQRVEDLWAVVDVVSKGTKAERTYDTYGKHWKHFEQFCAEYGLLALPATPDTALLFLAAYGSTRKTNTLRVAQAAIIHFHREAGLTPPTDMRISRFLMGHARLVDQVPEQKRALSTDHIRDICAMLDEEGGILARAFSCRSESKGDSRRG